MSAPDDAPKRSETLFCTKCRRHTITQRVFTALRASMQRTAQLIEIDLIAIESDRDYLHLMIAYPPTIGLSEAVRRLKGTSSRALRLMRLPEVVR